MLCLQEAFFLELRGDESAMRYYLAAYIALEEMTDTVDAHMISQVKAVAEYVSFKICNLHLRSSRVREALDFVSGGCVQAWFSDTQGSTHPPLGCYRCCGDHSFGGM